MTEFLTTAAGHRLAYSHSPGAGPGLVFLGGFKSDMEGSKARHLHGWARAQGRAFLRFDYSGHGQSSGNFEDGCIGDWAADAKAVIETLTSGPQVLIGSSMGGWIALLLLGLIPDRIAGLVGIAAAPDFSVRLWSHDLTDQQRAEVTRDGKIERPSGHADSPYVFTRKLFEDGAGRQVLNRPLHIPVPARFLQGTDDADVPVQVAVDLLRHATGPDIRLTLVKNADHRFSSAECLDLIVLAVEEIIGGTK